jgi:hypothetical protein
MWSIPSMRFDDRLQWYLQGQFTAADAERASGIAEGSQRTLQKARIFSPIPQARTAQRLLFADTVMRLSIAGELNRCGIHLIPSSKIIHADMFLSDFLFHLVDPIEVFFEMENRAWVRRKDADPDGLFDSKKPVGLHRTDQFIEIVNSRYVFTQRTTDNGFILGELTTRKTDFIVWSGSAWDHVVEGKKPRPTLINDSGLRAIASKKPTSADKKAAEFARSNPTSKITVNAGMALRASLRRLLFIDGAAESQD